MRFLLILLIFSLLNSSYSKTISNPEHESKLLARKTNFIDPLLDPAEKTSKFWIEKGKKFVEKQSNLKLNTKRAKNIIFFIGDGMSLATIAATRAYAGGEEKQLSFEKFPYTGLSKTYCLDKITPDSASTSTAYLTGVKTNYGTIGVNGKVKRGICEVLSNQTATVSIGQWALNVKKSIGFVTTTRVTHASPAGLYANVADRNWENDSEIKRKCGEKSINIKDIADQLINGKIGKEMTVILGGGRREFLNKTEEEPENKRTDGRNLIEEWKTQNSEKRLFVQTREDLLEVNPKKVDRLLGLFNEGHISYKNRSESYEPTLEEMTKKAIEMLQDKGSDNGFFLFVEGGLIDKAHHSTYAEIAFQETLEFSKAIQTAREMTSEDDTLIVVSSDHSHTMSIAGYPNRHNNILGVASESDLDDKSFLTINYANGKAVYKYIKDDNSRKSPVKVLAKKSPLRFPATFLKSTETHGGEDVAVYASGPWAHLFTGVYEQSFLPHFMAHAANLEYKKD